MNKITGYFWPVFLFLFSTGAISAYDFDYEKISGEAYKYTVVVEIEAEISFGTQSTEMKNRGIGAIVSADGLIIFDGAPIYDEDPFSIMAGAQLNIEPKKIEITLMDEKTYPAEFIGIDQLTKLGFCRIVSDKEEKFEFLKLDSRADFKVGEMLTTYLLLPKYVTPPLAADFGMISAVVSEPERFILTAGFNEFEVASVLYDSSGSAVGILVRLSDQGQSEVRSGAESFSNIEDFFPLLGIGDVDKIQKLIADPPKKGEITRGWLGIHLQALTADMAEFWNLNIGGGIIVNDVVADSPADVAGMKTGDIIVKLDGHAIDVDSEETLPIFRRKILELAAGTSVNFEIFRRENGGIDTLEITAVLTKTPLSPAEAPYFEDTNFEIKIRDMVFADYTFYNLEQNKFEGVVVKEVENGGWASVGGINPGDIIQAVGGTKVANIDETKKLMEKLAKERPKDVIFFVWRDNKTLFINIKTDW